MARGVRKTPTQRLNEELVKTKDEIRGHKNAIKTLEEKLRQIDEQLKTEELRELSTVLEENKITISELKDLIANNDKTK